MFVRTKSWRYLAVFIPLWLAGHAATAGEIVVGGDTGQGRGRGDASSASAEASRQRATARDYRKEQVAAPPVLVIMPDEEEGILSPRMEPESAADSAASAARARAARQGDGGQVVVPLQGADADRPATGETPAAYSARKNRERAAAYRKGAQPVTVVTGNDALPVVDCSNVDNVAGRIGDDTQSGSVITLMQGRNQVRVRCR
ncbi:MAG: hypothetical protein KBF29_10710 [Sterolibacterium sp.]|nr:hypothetical protein [Sterolibacterium sp.]